MFSKLISNVTYVSSLYVLKIASAFCLDFAWVMIKYFVTWNVSAGNITLCPGQNVAHKLGVERVHMVPQQPSYQGLISGTSLGSSQIQDNK